MAARKFLSACGGNRKLHIGNELAVQQQITGK
jgi:hypothetical protein